MKLDLRIINRIYYALTIIIIYEIINLFLLFFEFKLFLLILISNTQKFILYANLVVLNFNVLLINNDQDINQYC